MVKIDLLIVYNGENWKEPWPSEDTPKQGSLSEMTWNLTTDKEATYYKHEYSGSEDEWFKEGAYKRTIYKAIRIWPK